MVKPHTEPTALQKYLDTEPWLETPRKVWYVDMHSGLVEGWLHHFLVKDSSKAVVEVGDRYPVVDAKDVVHTEKEACTAAWIRYLEMAAEYVKRFETAITPTQAELAASAVGWIHRQQKKGREFVVLSTREASALIAEHARELSEAVSYMEDVHAMLDGIVTCQDANKDQIQLKERLGRLIAMYREAVEQGRCGA